jgi:hypothetical protein
MAAIQPPHRKLHRFVFISVIQVAVIALASGGYRVATGYWPLQAEDKREHPGVGSLEEAQELAPFQLLIPTYLPDGLRLGHAAVLTRPPRGPGEPHGGVNGVSLTYRTYGRPDVIFEQELGEVHPYYNIGNAEKVDTVTIRGESADLWQGENAHGRVLFALSWDEPSRGIAFYLTSFRPQEEALRIANSLRPLE